MNDLISAVLDMFAYEMVLNINVLGAIVMARVLGQVHSTAVIKEDSCWMSFEMLKFKFNE